MFRLQLEDEKMKSAVQREKYQRKLRQKEEEQAERCVPNSYFCSVVLNYPLRRKKKHKSPFLICMCGTFVYPELRFALFAKVC